MFCLLDTIAALWAPQQAHLAPPCTFRPRSGIGQVESQGRGSTSHLCSGLLEQSMAPVTFLAIS